MRYSKAEDILWSQKWEADQLLKARSNVLTWAIQEADKISKKHVLHHRCLTHSTPAKRKSHLTGKIAACGEKVWKIVGKGIEWHVSNVVRVKKS